MAIFLAPFRTIQARSSKLVCDFFCSKKYQSQIHSKYLLLALACILCLGTRSESQSLSPTTNSPIPSRRQSLPLSPIDLSNRKYSSCKTQENCATYDQTLPAGTAIVGRVIFDIYLDPDRKYDMPVTLLSAMPVYASNGEVAIPQNSLITSLIQKQSGGDYITIDRLVYRGLNIPLPSEGRLIPAQVKPENYNNYIYPPKTKTSSIFGAADQSNLIPTLLAIGIANSYRNNGESTAQSITPLVLGVLGIDAGVKILAALFDGSPKRIPPLVEIPKDSLIVFTVNSEIALPNSASPDTTLNGTQ